LRSTTVVVVTAGASVSVSASASHGERGHAAERARSGVRRVGGTAVGVAARPATARRTAPGRGNVVNVYTNEDDVDAWVKFDDDLDWQAMIPHDTWAKSGG
ncbi:MAG: hypothetical protein AAGK78_00760, partial [Planctomycetota bacterium]